MSTLAFTPPLPFMAGLEIFVHIQSFADRNRKRETEKTSRK